MLPSIFKSCAPRELIQLGEISEEIFAAKLRFVVKGNAPSFMGMPILFLPTLSQLRV
jgi:hypothetical protein